MLEGYGIHTLIWDAADERIGDWLIASPADAAGRGIELHVRQGGAAADLTDANVYFVWRHKRTGVRGCEPMTAIDASLGAFYVYYPAAMCEEEGPVDAQCMVSWDDRSISTRAFSIHVEPVLVGGTESEDGFTLFVETIKRYEDVIEVTSDAADAATAAASAANDAAGAANQVATAIEQAAQRGDFDGADGFSPTATVTQTAEGATITITDGNGTTTASVAKGAKGDKGDTGATGPKGDKGDTGDTGPQGIQGETGPKGDKGDTGATGAQGPKGDTGDTGATGSQGPKGDKGDTGDTGATGPQGPKGDTGDTGPKGDTGAAGADGNDGISCTHSWSGTVLSITSASGTSSADLVGPQGPTGATGATGPQGPAGADGADGTVFTPVAPLALSNGELSLDLDAYSLHQALTGVYDFTQQKALPEEGSASSKSFPSSQKAGHASTSDLLFDTVRDRLAYVQSSGNTGANKNLGFKTIFDFAALQGIVVTTTADVAAGSLEYFRVGRKGHAIREGTLVLNTSTGNLMVVYSTVIPIADTQVPEARLLGLGNIYNANASGGATYTAASPLSIDANDEISIDLSGYAALAGATFTGAVSGIAPTANAHFATKKYVDDAIAALDDLSGVSF